MSLLHSPQFPTGRDFSSQCLELLFPDVGNRSSRHWEEKSLPVGNNTACDVNPV